ncbi:MAG: TlpA family protein disulfide reductase [Acidobacteriia bacterium]|nr:TlpA family protein disulfide reductase [Terriglobia bacterium]
MRHVIFVLLCFATAACQSQPQLSLKDMDGKAHSLSDYRGKIVVLNFWATWCVPCRDEMPIFVEAQKKFGQRNLVILAASLDDARTQKYVRKFVKTYKMDFPVLLDASAELMARFGLGETVPSTIFLDTQGNIVDKIQGQARRKDLLSRIGRLLSDQDAPPKAVGQPTPQKTPPPTAAP